MNYLQSLLLVSGFLLNVPAFASDESMSCFGVNSFLQEGNEAELMDAKILRFTVPNSLSATNNVSKFLDDEWMEDDSTLSSDYLVVDSFTDSKNHLITIGFNKNNELRTRTDANGKQHVIGEGFVLDLSPTQIADSAGVLDSRDHNPKQVYASGQLVRGVSEYELNSHIIPNQTKIKIYVVTCLVSITKP